MNLKFVQRVSERVREREPFVIVKNKIMSVFISSVLILILLEMKNRKSSWRRINLIYTVYTGHVACDMFSCTKTFF